jgi:hypothetical protein
MFDQVLGNFCQNRGGFRGVLSRSLIFALLFPVLASFPNTSLAQQGSFAFTGSPIGGPAGGGLPVRLTVTGNFTSGSTTLSHATQLTLVVH